MVYAIFSTEKMSLAPDNVEVYYNSLSRTYLAPPCKLAGSYSNAEKAFQAKGTIEYLSSIGAYDDLERVIEDYGDIILIDQAWSTQIISLGTAKEMGFAPDNECRKTGAFSHSGNAFLIWIGVLPPSDSRWNEDGSWNW